MTPLHQALQRYLSPPPETASLSTAELVAAIKRHSQSAHGTRLTNLRFPETVRVGELTFDYAYKRDQFRGPDTQRLYFLLNSGQAAINLCTLYLKMILGLDQVRIHSPVYVGVKEAADVYGLVLSSKLPSASLWICSSDYQETNTEENYPFVVIDSSCWAQDDPTFLALKQRYLASTVFVVRSISKLDMAGVEYGSLGSLEILGGISQQDQLREKFERLIRLTGSVPSVDDVPPYLFDEAYLACVNERVRALQAVVKEIKHALGEQRCVFPSHGIYFFVPLPSELFLGREVKLKGFWSKLMEFQGMSARPLASFGFDDCVWSFYSDADTQKHWLRICPGQGDERSSRVIDAVTTFLEKLTA